MNNQGYTPYMFGGNTGYPAPGNPAPQVNNANNYNVRDCMYWPASLANAYDGMASRPNNTSVYLSFNNRGDQFTDQLAAMGGTNGSDPYTFHTGATNSHGTGEPQMRLPPQAPIKAFVSTGEGGSGKSIQIPCHMGPGPGQVPQIPNMPPMGYKVTIPPVDPTPPVDFEIKQ